MPESKENLENRIKSIIESKKLSKEDLEKLLTGSELYIKEIHDDIAFMPSRIIDTQYEIKKMQENIKNMQNNLKKAELRNIFHQFELEMIRLANEYIKTALKEMKEKEKPSIATIIFPNAEIRKDDEVGHIIIDFNGHCIKLDKDQSTILKDHLEKWLTEEKF